MKNSDYRDRFKTNVDAYEEVTQSKHIRLIYELEKNVLTDFFRSVNSREKTLMDFACGSGRWTQVLENLFNATTGVDVSDKMIELARAKCQKVDFIVTDITSKNVAPRLHDMQFDVITAFRFFKNAQQQLREKAVEQIPQYLKPKGYFIFDLHLNTYSFMGILANIINFLRLNTLFKIDHLTTKTISLCQIRKLFKNSQFKIVDYYGMGLLPGRSNYTILPKNLLRRIESFLTGKKLFRNFSYNILIIAKKQ